MLKKLDKNKIPQHIGIIMDGNGRWAKKRFLPRLKGHEAGVYALKNIIQAGKDLGIKIMSFYAFSTENWQRDKKEVYGIFDLIVNNLKENYKKFIDSNIKITTMGDITKLPEELYNLLLDIKEKTKNHTGLIVNLGLNYGSRLEIVRACNNLINNGNKNITIDNLKNELYTKDLIDPDLIIRTSGEQRLSNFMLFQSAYSELYFTKTYWPDFNKKHLIKAIINYQRRDRRFGNIKQEKK